MPKKKKQPSREKLIANLKAAVKKTDDMRSKLYRAEEEEQAAINAYEQSIQQEAQEILRGLTWEWPGRRGRRTAKVIIKSNSAFAKLIAPLRVRDNKTYMYVNINNGERLTVQEEYYSSDLKLSLSFPAAKALGIVNPTKRKDWAKLKKQLEIAGITDPDQLAEVLKEKTS